jgi:ABC-type uncharacterized transport system ATPase subunit
MCVRVRNRNIGFIRSLICYNELRFIIDPNGAEKSTLFDIMNAKTRLALAQWLSLVR